MKNRITTAILILSLSLFYGCGEKAEKASSKETSNQGNNPKTLTVWSWNIAAKGLQLTVDSFQKAHPGVKVEVKDIGRSDMYDKLTVGLASGSGLPDIVTIESDRMPGYAVNFPNGFYDMSSGAKDYIKDFDQSKWAQSNIDGKILSIPWDSGPVAMFYRKDMFSNAGVDIKQIETWNDFIAAGKKIQNSNPGVKMMCTSFTTDDGLFRVLMNELGTFYFNEKGEITINSDKAVQAMALIRQLKEEDLFLNADSWDASVTATKNGKVAVSVTGVWWGGTLKDQAPELSGKWGVAFMPAFTNTPGHASNLGGSTLAITSQSKNPELAWEFVKNSLATVDNQMKMYKQCDLFPSYLPVYKAEGFAEPDKYYGGEKAATIFAEVVPDIKPAYYTKDYAEAQQYSINALAEVITKGASPKTALDKAAQSIANTTGRQIAK